MVRLKASSGLVSKSLTSAFQFHNGSIKSEHTVYQYHHSVNVFQFHNGSIKRAHDRLPLQSPLHCFNSTMVRLKDSDPPQSGGVTILFQFHNGSIKSKYIEHSSKVEYKFQFHNGSIKSCKAFSIASLMILVSIPQWFD